MTPTGTNQAGRASLRQALVDAAAYMNRCGINQGRSGNLSVRVNDTVLITASGCHFDKITTDDIVETSLSGEWSGPRPPSSELSFHTAIYRSRPEIRAVVHLHSPWATSLACMHRSIPAFHYMVAAAGGCDIPCAPYATFGTEALASSITPALRERDACLIANHGQIAIGKDLAAALELAVEVESLARCYGQILSMGEPVLLTGEQMAAALERFRTYRQ